MEVSGKLKFKSSSPDPHKFIISLTINFNEQWVDLPGGHVQFGIRGGELRLDLVNGAVPYSHRNLTGTLVPEVQKERETQISAATRVEEKSSVGSSLKKDSELKTDAATTNERKGSYTQSDKFTINSRQITTKGSLDKPAWVFEVQTEEPVLKGELSDVELATVIVSENRWKIKATFEVKTLKDVILTETDGPWLRNASPERRTALELGIAKLMLKKLFRPYLSYVELGYE